MNYMHFSMRLSLPARSNRNMYGWRSAHVSVRWGIRALSIYTGTSHMFKEGHGRSKQQDDVWLSRECVTTKARVAEAFGVCVRCGGLPPQVKECSVEVRKLCRAL